LLAAADPARAALLRLTVLVREPVSIDKPAVELAVIDK